MELPIENAHPKPLCSMDNGGEHDQPSWFLSRYKSDFDLIEPLTALLVDNPDAGIESRMDGRRDRSDQGMSSLKNSRSA